MNMKKILKRIAKENGVTVEEVREEMQKAITEAWKNPPADGGVTAAYQRKVPCKGEVPTPEELVCCGRDPETGRMKLSHAQNRQP